MLCRGVVLLAPAEKARLAVESASETVTDVTGGARGIVRGKKAQRERRIRQISLSH